LALYARDGVPEACLHLQNRHDLDVPMVLFAAFVGAVRRETLTASDLEAARGSVDAWHHEVVRPLRAVRQRLKSGPAPAPNDITARLRSEVQRIEIAAELIELDQLDTLIPALEPTPASGSAAECAAAAIESVVQAISRNPTDHRDHQAIDTIAHAATQQVIADLASRGVTDDKSLRRPG
jgi:uncharacterized protein (TIGR02444 family)